MRVRLGDTSIFFDAEGAKYIQAGATLREQSTLILIHGAPGFADHSAYKPAFSHLRWCGTCDAQFVYAFSAPSALFKFLPRIQQEALQRARNMHATEAGRQR